ncbi:MAG: SUMF1/EgtB/PvdO family nonheme iron enzyme [Synergistaceae bacterium]|nr:SUMF1/EgtB/PvdO family nonheme iron enzyme [Synergistaceae bacterium]
MKILLAFVLIFAFVSSSFADSVKGYSDFVHVQGGSFLMGSPESENWRSDDELQHRVTLSDFDISRYEVTQSEYESLTGENPSTFKGAKLPVDSVTWLEAVKFCNAKSESEGLTPAYKIDGDSVTWDLSSDGYRLPTEAEWEYACRAGTQTPFNLEHSIDAEEANFYGHYPYEIEENYFSQHKLSAKPGIYRAETVNVGSFTPNKLGLYDMHGNVGEWCWDVYGAYSTQEQNNPTGQESGTRRVNRGGGWNDFAKNMRSAYRAAAPQDRRLYNVGFRLAKGSIGTGLITSRAVQETSGNAGKKILIAYFTWSGNTQGIAYEIQKQTGADIFEISPVKEYTESYNGVLREAQRDQRAQARPALKNHVKNFADYDVIMLGYPNWWASIPMPIASFLEEHDFTGKIIMPFCSHGGGRFGQSLTAIAKLAPKAFITDGLSVHYSGGSSLKSDIAKWLNNNLSGK